MSVLRAARQVDVHNNNYQDTEGRATSVERARKMCAFLNQCVITHYMKCILEHRAYCPKYQSVTSAVSRLATGVPELVPEAVVELKSLHPKGEGASILNRGGRGEEVSLGGTLQSGHTHPGEHVTLVGVAGGSPHMFFEAVSRVQSLPRIESSAI